MASMAELTRHDLEDIRWTVRQYGDDHRFDVSAAGRLYVLNRYAFNVPAHTSNPRLFGGFWREMGDEMGANELWPLAIDQAEHLRLVGTFLGYTGPPYAGLEEFDYFSHRYGLRRRTGL
jgi:hypothetical protein